jgi:WD40 repeat protein
VVILAFSDEGDRLYSYSLDHTVRAWDATPAGPGEGFMAATTGEIRGVSISPDGRTLVAHTVSGRDPVATTAGVSIWDVETAALVPPSAASGDAGLSDIAFSPHGATYAVQAGTVPGGVQVLDGATSAVLLSFDVRRQEQDCASPRTGAGWRSAVRETSPWVSARSRCTTRKRLSLCSGCGTSPRP